MEFFTTLYNYTYLNLNMNKSILRPSKAKSVCLVVKVAGLLSSKTRTVSTDFFLENRWSKT